MGQEKLAKTPLLVFANKQDLQFALEAEEILNHLKLMDIKDRTWNIQACSALTKEGKYSNVVPPAHYDCLSTGLQEGFKWLIDTIGQKN